MESNARDLQKDRFSREVAKLERMLPSEVDLMCLPKSCDTLLGECVTLWMNSGVESLDKASLSEYFLARQRERTKNGLIGHMLKIDIDSLEKELKHDEQDIAMLEKLLDDFDEKNPEELKKEQLSLNKQWEDLKQKNRMRSLSINLDQLIRKVELLETHSQATPKRAK